MFPSMIQPIPEKAIPLLITTAKKPWLMSVNGPGLIALLFVFEKVYLGRRFVQSVLERTHTIVPAAVWQERTILRWQSIWFIKHSENEQERHMIIKITIHGASGYHYVPTNLQILEMKSFATKPR